MKMRWIVLTHIHVDHDSVKRTNFWHNYLVLIILRCKDTTNFAHTQIFLMNNEKNRA